MGQIAKRMAMLDERASRPSSSVSFTAPPLGEIPYLYFISR